MRWMVYRRVPTRSSLRASSAVTSPLSEPRANVIHKPAPLGRGVSEGPRNRSKRHALRQCERCPPPTSGGMLMRTMSNIAARSVNLQGNCLVDDATGWAVGDGGLIVATHDGGERWLTQGESDKDLRAVCFVDGERGWVAGRDGTILRTDDGGDRWEAVRSGTDRNLYGICFASSGRTGWAVGDSGTILASTDGGATWRPQPAGDAHLTRCFAQDDRRAWAVGRRGRILATTDGVKWTVQASGTEIDLRAVVAASADVAWAVGRRGTVLH